METGNWKLGSGFLKRAVGLFCICTFLYFTSIYAQAPLKEAVEYDLLVKNGTIVTMDGERRVIEDGVVAARGDEIVFVGRTSDFGLRHAKGVTAKQTVDAKGKLVLPVFINGHTHVPMTLLRGLKDDVTLEEWLTKSIFPAEAKNVNEDFVRWGTRLAAP